MHLQLLEIRTRLAAMRTRILIAAARTAYITTTTTASSCCAYAGSTRPCVHGIGSECGLSAGSRGERARKGASVERGVNAVFGRQVDVACCSMLDRERERETERDRERERECIPRRCTSCWHSWQRSVRPPHCSRCSVSALCGNATPQNLSTANEKQRDQREPREVRQLDQANKNQE
jgi:hypothetical protein